MKGVESTKSLRTNIYFADGHGRDSYIFGDNGGFFKSPNKFSFEKSNNLSPKNYSQGSSKSGVW